MASLKTTGRSNSRERSRGRGGRRAWTPGEQLEFFPKAGVASAAAPAGATGPASRRSRPGPKLDPDSARAKAAVTNDVTAEQLAIEEGQAVIVTLDDGSLTQDRAESRPWQLGGHTWVVKLARRGTYALCRCTPVSKGGPC